MSSSYRVLCLSHDPAVVAADGGMNWKDPEPAEQAIAAGIEGHEQCDLLIGAYAYPLYELGCPPSNGDGRQYQHRCNAHSGTRWVDLGWLRLLALAQEQPEGSALRRATEDHVGTCWPVQRLSRLRAELSLGEPVVAPAVSCRRSLCLAPECGDGCGYRGEPVPSTDICADRAPSLGLVDEKPGYPDYCVLQQGHRSPEHRGESGAKWRPVEPAERCVICGSTDIRYHNYQAHPFCWPCADGTSPEAKAVIAASLADLCGHEGAPGDPPKPCTLPLGHDVHRDGDGCSWPATTDMDRSAIRSVIRFVASATGHPDPLGVEVLTDRLWDVARRPFGPAKPEPPTPPPCSINHDCPGQARPAALTARGEARCQSQHQAEGGALVQCALAVHADDAHTDYDSTTTPPPGRPADLPWAIWRSKTEEANRA